jgi:thioredoxin 2
MNQTRAIIIRCPECGVKNKIPEERIGSEAKCGKCHATLDTSNNGNDAGDNYSLRCLKCKSKNRVPAHKIDAGGRCGKCGASLPTGELFIPQPAMLTDGNFEQMVLKAPLPVLVYCWAPWCPTCGTVAPIIDEFAAESKGKIRVGKLNIDANQMVAAKYNVLSVPFLFIFDNGRLQESLPGGLQKHDLMMKMAHYL